MSPDIFHREVFNEDVVRVDDYRCAYAHVYGIVATAQTIVLDDNLVAVLSDEVDIWLCLRNINMFLVFAILDEDEPRFGSTSGSSINSSLYGLVHRNTRYLGSSISSSIDHGIIETILWLLTFHGGESDDGACYSISTTAYEYALRHSEGVLCSILQTTVTEDGTLTRDNRCNILSIESCEALSGLNLIIKGKDNATIGTHVFITICWGAAHESGCLLCAT